MNLVTTRIEDSIAHVRLSRQEKLNALTLDTLTELAGTARRLLRDRTLRAAVLAGDRDSFCSGLDIVGTLRSPRRSVGALLPVPWRGTNLFQEACWSWRRLGVPVIAAVHGHCYGGGLQIALGADFRFATPDSKWSVLEGKWGIIPDMTGIRTLSELVGLDIAKRLTMTAEVVTGAEAARLGLVTEVHDDPVAAATSFARQLAGRSPDAVAAAKRLLDAAVTGSARRTFARERRIQLRLLMLPNTRITQRAAQKKAQPDYRPRSF